MSLIVSNRATVKQIKMLKKLEYYGTLDLSVEEAVTLIDELFEQRMEEFYLDNDYLGVDMWGN